MLQNTQECNYVFYFPKTHLTKYTLKPHEILAVICKAFWFLILSFIAWKESFAKTSYDCQHYEDIDLNSQLG